ncbi:urease accessory protein UreD [Yoonia sp. 208BN28-4]|uniref:urease accessory protein UreD n=1 Tax=Yoonia sp. 208BN28-4 TaxID=3126505 RepID=UPI0030A2AE08
MTCLAGPIEDAGVQRARGRVSLTVKRRGLRASVIDRLHQDGSLKAVFPRGPSDRLDAVLVNTAGGVTGGDSFAIDAHATTGTQALITTQAAERIYRAQAGQTGSISAQIQVDRDASLFWVPQETILFDACNLNRVLAADVHPHGQFVMIEPVVFGREASGETLQTGMLRDAVTIRSGGKPIYMDRVKLDGSLAQKLPRPAVAAGARAMANIVVVRPDAAADLAPIRQILSPHGYATQLRETVVVGRILCADSFVLRQALMPLLDMLTANRPPKNWRL